MKITIQICCSHFQVRANFFSDVLEHIHEPELLEAIKADGVANDELFADADKAYAALNSPKSKTRNWLIVRNLHKFD